MFSGLILTNKWYQQLYHQLKEAMDLDKVSCGLVSLPQKESMVQIGALLTSGDWYSIFIYSNTGEHEGGKKKKTKQIFWNGAGKSRGGIPMPHSRWRREASVPGDFWRCRSSFLSNICFIWDNEQGRCVHYDSGVDIEMFLRCC